MINYTIIIPHKDSPDLLQRCIDSIPQRDDLQIIIIDDCSSPSKVDFNKFPGRDRKNIEIYFTKEGKGAGYARNIGLQYAKGKWLLFADADDFYSDNISSLFDSFSGDCEWDLIYLNAQYVNEQGEIKPYVSTFYINNFLENKFLSEITLKYELWAPWSRMVKRDFIYKYNLKFEEVPIGNDLKFGLETSRYAQRISVFPLITYNYYKPNAGSITAHKYSVQTYELRLKSTKWMNDFLKEVKYPFPRTYLNLFNLNNFKTKKEKEYAKKIMKTFIHESKISIIYECYKFFKRRIARVFKIIA